VKHITSDRLWPPPPWTEVIVPWDWLMESESRSINDIIDWVNQAPGGRYHLHGWKSTRGFAFRFEEPIDAFFFQLSLPL